MSFFKSLSVKTRRRRLLQGLILLLVLTATIPAFTEEKPAVKLSSHEISLSASLKAREEAVAVREKAAAEKEKELAALAREIEDRYAQLSKSQEEFKAQLVKAGPSSEVAATKGKEQNFKRLIKVYSEMSPSKLAPLLDKMEDQEAVEILKAMKTEAVAKIIPKLAVDKAVRVSRLLGMP